MSNLEKRVAKKENIKDTEDSYYVPRRESSGGALAWFIPVGGFVYIICMDEMPSRIFGEVLVGGGIAALWVEFYSPIKMGKEIVKDIWELAYFSLNYLKR